MKRLLVCLLSVVVVPAVSLGQTVGGVTPGCVDVGEVSVITLEADLPLASVSANGLYTFEAPPPAWFFGTVGVDITIKGCANFANNGVFTYSTIVGSDVYTNNFSSVSEPGSPGTLGRIKDWAIQRCIFHYRQHHAQPPEQVVQFKAIGDITRGAVYHVYNDVPSWPPPVNSTIIHWSEITDVGTPSASTRPFRGLSRNLSTLGQEFGHRWIAENIFDPLEGEIGGPGRVSHWSTYVDTEGSYVEGNNWQDNGNGTFTLIDHDVRWGPYDLHMMGIKPFGELGTIYKILNPVQVSLEPLVVQGQKQVFTPTDVFGQGLQQNATPYIVNLRFVILTKVGTPLPLSDVNHVSQVRRDWGHLFQRQTLGLFGEKRGVMTTSMASMAHNPVPLPDLVVGEIEAPLRGQPGQLYTVTVHNHNQSLASFGTTFSTGIFTKAASTTRQTGYTKAGMQNHEIHPRITTFTIPGESSLFEAQVYQGSFRVRILVDEFGVVGEAGEPTESYNDREVEVMNSRAFSDVAAPPASGQIVAGPVVAGGYSSLIYIVRKTSTGSFKVEGIGLDNPLAPTVTSTQTLSLSANETVTALAADTQTFVVGIYGPSVNAGSIRTYNYAGQMLNSVPLSKNPQSLAINGTTLYVGRYQGIEVIPSFTGSNPQPRTPSPWLLAPGNIRVLRVSGSSLFSLRDDSVQRYSLANPLNPSANGNFFMGTYCWDLWVDGTYAYVALDRWGLKSVNTSTGAQSSYQHPPSVVLVNGVLSMAGQYLVAQTYKDVWTVLQVTNGAFTKTAEAWVDTGTGVPASLPNPAGTWISGWCVLADHYGVRLFSPRGTTDRFIRGDANGDGVIDVSDSVKLGAAMFQGDSFMGLQDAFDVDDSGTLNISDLIYFNSYMQGGPPPPPPFPTEGTDPTPDSLGYVRPK